MTQLIRGLGHLALGVPDVEASVQDAVNVLGLRETDRRDSTIYLSSNDRHHELRFSPAPEVQVEHIGLEVFSRAALESLRDRLGKAGTEIVSDEPSDPALEAGVRFLAPGGHVFEAHLPAPRNQAKLYTGAGVHPTRLEHVNLKTQDVDAFADFMLNVLGFKLSDRTNGDDFMWFRAGNSFHHTVAIFRSDEESLHHYAWDLREFGDFMRLGDNLVTQDRAYFWGPGRHGAGDNCFVYYFDHNGVVVECSVGMMQVEDEELYEPTTWDFTPDLSDLWINRWGTPPPRDFAQPGVPYAPMKRSVETAR